MSVLQSARVTTKVALTIAACVAPASAGFGQPADGKVQPAALTFGQVQVGSTVEGSVRIFISGDDYTGLSLSANPPRFVSVKGVELGTRTYGQSGTVIYCDVSVSISTKEPGEHGGMLQVQIGDRTVDIPVSATVLPKNSSAKRVLVVATPFQKFSTDDPSLFASWLELVESADLAPSYLAVVRGHPILRDTKLPKFDTVLLGEEALVVMQEEDVRRLEHFAKDGGRLVLFANRFFRGTVDGANRLLVDSGLRMLDSESHETREFDAGDQRIAVDRFTKNVGFVGFFRPSPIDVTNASTAKILIAAPFPGQGFVAAARMGEGEIVAVGQSLWWNWIGDDRFSDTHNQRLLRNILTKPATVD